MPVDMWGPRDRKRPHGETWMRPPLHSPYSSVPSGVVGRANAERVSRALRGGALPTRMRVRMHGPYGGKGLQEDTPFAASGARRPTFTKKVFFSKLRRARSAPTDFYQKCHFFETSPPELIFGRFLDDFRTILKSCSKFSQSNVQ